MSPNIYNNIKEFQDSDTESRVNATIDWLEDNKGGTEILNKHSEKILKELYEERHKLDEERHKLDEERNLSTRKTTVISFLVGTLVTVVVGFFVLHRSWIDKKADAHKWYVEKQAESTNRVYMEKIYNNEIKYMEKTYNNKIEELKNRVETLEGKRK